MEKALSKIGVGITTYNSENYYKDLYNSLKNANIDELVTVNGGNKYSGTYNCDWIQHNKNRYPSVCRNDCISFLLNKGCEHIFLIEDDMIIKDVTIFEKYINTALASKLKYLCFVSTSWESGSPGARTPSLIVNYTPEISLSLYQNMCNEFTYHHFSCFKDDMYDFNMRDMFDVEMVYRQSQKGNSTPFWWFPDITGSDDYIENNPEAQSRLQTDRPDGSRQSILPKLFEYFANKHKIQVNQIPKISKQEVISFLKQKK